MQVPAELTEVQVETSTWWQCRYHWIDITNPGQANQKSGSRSKSTSMLSMYNDLVEGMSFTWYVKMWVTGIHISSYFKKIKERKANMLLGCVRFDSIVLQFKTTSYLNHFLLLEYLGVLFQGHNAKKMLIQMCRNVQRGKCGFVSKLPMLPL